MTEATDLRAQIANANDIVDEIVEVPEWGVTLAIRTMTGAERAAFLKATRDPKTNNQDPDKSYPDIIVRTARHPVTKELVFTPTDRDLINSKGGPALERLATVALRLAGLTGDQLAAAQGESTATQKNGSTSS